MTLDLLMRDSAGFRSLTRLVRQSFNRKSHSLRSCPVTDLRQKRLHFPMMISLGRHHLPKLSVDQRNADENDKGYDLHCRSFLLSIGEKSTHAEQGAQPRRANHA
ncbi:MAG: hypothetical protein ACLQU3_01970 [Limisphaerales bacterium]